MCRNTTVCCGRLLALFFLWFSPCVLAQSTAEPAHNEVVIKNAIVMTVTHGNLKNASVYVKDGKIAAVGETVNAPASATVIDAGGKYLTPGIIDSHSHLALDDDVNEATSPVTPQMTMIDAFDYQDKAIYRALAGGVTTSLLLHGSANMIGGQAIVIKHKYGENRDAMLFPGAPRSVEFASGENPKRVYGGRNQLPSTRMGNFEVQREALVQAQEYMRDWDAYNAKVKSDSEDFTRRLNQEAAKTMRYGGATEDEALKMITINPAWIVGVDDRVGSIDVGKDADLVIWDGYPLSSYGVPDKVFIDGDVYFDRSLPGFGMPHYKEGE